MEKIWVYVVIERWWEKVWKDTRNFIVWQKKILKNKVQQKISLLYRCYWNKAYDNNWKFPGKDQKLDMISYIFVGPVATKC